MFTAWKEGPKDNSLEGIKNKIIAEALSPEERAAKRAEIADRKAAIADYNQIGASAAPTPQAAPAPTPTPQAAPAPQAAPQKLSLAQRMAQAADQNINPLTGQEHEAIMDASRDVMSKVRPTKLPAQVGGGGRANANFNFAELLVGGALAFPEAENFEQLQNEDLSLMNISGLSQYLGDAKSRDPKLIQKTMDNFRRLSAERGLGAQNPQDVYIRNTNQSLLPPELKDKIEGLSDRARMDKADVLFKNHDDKFKGISVKDDPKNWESSYSINKMLNSFSDRLGLKDDEGNDVKLGEHLEEVRKAMYRQAGLPTSELDWRQQNPGDPDGWKRLRDQNKFNEMFFDDNNAYHKRARELIDEYGPDVKKYMLDGWFPRTPYDMMLFNQDNLSDLSRDQFNDDDLELSHIKNPAKNPKGAAKSFMAAKMRGAEDPMKLIELRLKTPFTPHHFVTHPWQKGKHQNNPLV